MRGCDIAADDLDLPAEALRPDDRGHFRVHHLHRDPLLPADLARQVHHGHPALGDLALEHVPVAKRLRQRLLQCRLRAGRRRMHDALRRIH